MPEPHENGRCTTRRIIDWLGVMALSALVSATALAWFKPSEATVIVGIVGIVASVASGLIGYLGGRGAQQSLTTGRVESMTVEGSPTVKQDEGAAVGNGAGAG